MSDYDHAPGGTLKLKGGNSTTKEILEEEKTKPVRVIEKTEAEKKFEEIQRKRFEERVQKAARKSHKDREFNRKLDEMTEHYDIPKVGPG
ncbi:2222_t:CDS:2 [Entrophospora sp. SA101]|nr:2060_t:CDS:2 [Entrophospora sp. SA101]CAJ0883701.1 12227_t:CDS:2 [Entrophospora sp. SA101]CAJ0909200.1 2222_t:CDS:2 [Entrophospora sp. SA101]